MNRLAAALAVFALLATAKVLLRDRPPRPAGPAVALPGGREAPFEYAPVRHAKEAPPARFAAPLPRVAEFDAFDAERFPPRAHVRDLLCRGDEGAWRRAREAIAASRGATLADVERTYGDLLEFCPGDGCFAARQLAGGQAATVALPAWLVLASCPSREADALFRRPDAPAAALLARADRAEWGEGIAAPAPDRVVAAALEVIAASPPRARRLPAFRLAAAGRQGAEALLALHAKEEDPGVRHDYAMALSRVGDPRARRAWREACAKRDDAACPRDERPEAAPPRDAPDPEPDRAPPPGALVARLRALGLLPDADLPAARVAGLRTADHLLAAARRAHAFDTETGMFPNEHDSLLRDLAALAPGGLDGALFDEVPPPEDDEERPYVLRAWAFGERWEVDAQNLGDWFDVEACVGLLNAVARARGLEVRWVVLETGDQTAIVAAGPEAGLRAAIAEGLLAPAGARDAMDAGKAFEEKVLEELRRGQR